MQTIKIKTFESCKKNITQKEITAFLQSWAKSQIANQKFASQMLDGFAKIESGDTRVSDIVMTALTYADFRRSLRDYMTVTNKKSELMTGLMCVVFGANLWVNRQAKDHEAKLYEEKSPQLKKDFPAIAKSKKLLKI